MTQHPRIIQQLHRQAMASIRHRLAALETKTSCIDSGFPLAMLPAVIDPAYSSGDPKCSINGAALSGPYQHLASYTPAAGDSVLVAPVGVQSTYVILGRLA